MLTTGRSLKVGLASQTRGLRTVIFKYEMSASVMTAESPVSFQKDIAVIRVNSFASTDMASLGDALKSKKSALKGVIIDLRSNPGGNFSALQTFLEFVLPSGTTYGRLNSSRATSTLVTRAAPVIPVSMRIVLILNEGQSNAVTIIRTLFTQMRDADVIIEAESIGKNDVTSTLQMDLKLKNGDVPSFGFLSDSDTFSMYRPKDPHRVKRKDASDTPLQEALKLFGF